MLNQAQINALQDVLAAYAELQKGIVAVVNSTDHLPTNHPARHASLMLLAGTKPVLQALAKIKIADDEKNHENPEIPKCLRPAWEKRI